MKKVKIIGLLVAFGGVVGSFAAASALYLSGAEEVGFGIGATYTAANGTIDYSINGESSGTIAAQYWNESGSKKDGAGIGGEYTQVVFEFPVGASFTVNPQPYVVGNFTVNLSNINSALFNKAKVWVQVGGWTGEYEGKYGSTSGNSNFMNEDAIITSATFSVNKDIGVSATEEQSVMVYFKLDDAVTNAATMLSLAETGLFDIDVVWEAEHNYDHAYVVGNKNGWEEDDIYAMQPNLKAESFSWYFAGLTGFTLGKAKIGTDYSTGDDAVLEPEKTYNVSWVGAGNAAGFAEA